MSQENEFLGKVAIVTGAASGIGLETAKLFAAGKAKVALIDLNQEKLKQAKEEVVGPAETWTCDVAKADRVAQVVGEVVSHFGGLDIIVNNAGVMIFKPLAEHTTEDWWKVLGVDLLGAFYFTQQAFLKMKNGGVVINVSSIHAVETTPSVTSYAAAKSAILSLTRSAAIEGKAKGIRVNAVLPGAIDTPMLWENPNIKSGLEVIKQGDVGSPKDIAECIGYLASERARFVQGAMLRVDGGRLAQL